MSPSSRARLSGMPWQMTSLTEVQSALRVAVVVERTRVAPVPNARVVADGVELVGGDAGGDGAAGLLEDLGGRLARPPQPLRSPPAV